MKKNRISRFVALIMALVMILSAMCFAEELGEVDLYAPEIYSGEVAIAAPASESEQALELDTKSAKEAASAVVEILDEDPSVEGPVEYAVAASALEPMSATQTVALTGKKANAQMNIGDSLQITVKEGETGKFTSKKAKFATVDANGLVKAIKKGTATIIFKPTKGKQRTLTIKIADPYEPKKISISQGKTVTVNLGDSLQLGTVLSPGTARTTLSWSSSKKKIASVSASGTVTGLKEGKTKVTVKTANKKKATITVKVVDPYKPTGVSITQGKSATLTVGETLQLSAMLSPSTAQSGLTWKSSKSKIAKVDSNGLVTAVGKGTATITVTTRNGKKATCKVTVKSAPRNEDWSSVYKNFVVQEEYYNLSLFFGEFEDPNFGLYDMERDGIPELLISNGANPNRSTAYVFTCINGRIKYIGDAGFRITSDSSLYYFDSGKYPGLFCDGGSGGIFESHYYYIKDGKVKDVWLEEVSENGIIYHTKDKALLTFIYSGQKAYEFELVWIEELAEMGWEAFVKMYC